MLAKVVLLHLLCVLIDAREFINFSDIQCGNTNNRQGKVVGGGDAVPGEFPWLVSLTRRGGHFCGGTLISKRHVLTAGHCICNGIDGFIKPASIKITIGQYDLSSASEAYEMIVHMITAHPEYKCSKVRNDIAILELDSDVTWSDFVQPACLSMSKAEDAATVAGWGWTSENNTLEKTSILQKAQVTILDNDVCKMWYHSQGKKTKIQQTQMCAGRKEGGVDSCWADSGGPLMIDNANGNILSVVGIVSTGIGCARPYLPGIYTRISEYMIWIQSELEK